MLQETLFITGLGGGVPITLTIFNWGFSSCGSLWFWIEQPRWAQTADILCWAPWPCDSSSLGERLGELWLLSSPPQKLSAGRCQPTQRSHGNRTWHWNLIWILILPLVCLSFHVLTYKPREEPVSLGYWTRWTHSLKCVTYNTAASAKSLQSCPTLCDPVDGSPPGSPVPGIPQARTLEWVAISFSNAWKWEVKVKSLSHAWLLATPWAAAYQAPPSMGFSRQEDWSGVPLPSPNV